VLSFFSVVGIGTPPQTSPAGECVLPPPPRSRGEGHTRWRERGWESTNSDEGTYTVVLFIYTYFVVGTMGVNRAGTGRGCLAWQPYPQVEIDI
jgi:hypothetical protein